MAAFVGIVSGLRSRALAGRRRFGLPQLYASAARLGQSDGNCLLGGPGAMLPFPDVMNFFAHKFAGLSGGSLAIPRILLRSL
jgi:hypothetical protein